ncbi:MAG TPA: TadE/TadG family type IV pilus assembly protein [Lacipirellulaceae bacterium]|jgi:Flp pilus assembly protein TadG
MRSVQIIAHTKLRISDCGLWIEGRRRTNKSVIRNPKSEIRKGAAAVEFAVVAPVLVAIMMGLIQSGRGYEAKNLLAGAAREGARYAAMDRSKMASSGQTTNQKLINDVKNFLSTDGIPKQDITVTVKDANVPTKDFNLDDPNNNLKLFAVNVSVKYSDVSFTTVSASNDYTLNASIVFRNGQATISN